MLRVQCPVCRVYSDFPEEFAGQKVACPCGQKMQLAPPASQNKTVLVPYESEPIPYAKPAPEPTWVEPIREKRRRPPSDRWAGFVLCSLLGFGLLAGFFMMVSLSESKSQNNAECYYCGHEFSIPEYKGLARDTSVHKCPKCGATSLVNDLYKRRR